MTDLNNSGASAGSLPMRSPHSGIGRSHGSSLGAPFDRWFRYPAGFASDYVTILLEQLKLGSGKRVVDPFAGAAIAGTSSVAMGCTFYGIEAHPGVAELGDLKLKHPPSDPATLLTAALVIVAEASTVAHKVDIDSETDLVRRSFDERKLQHLCAIRNAIVARAESRTWSAYLKWALLATLRDVASVRVGWPYQAPRHSRKPKYTDVTSRFIQRVSQMVEDLENARCYEGLERSRVVHGDSREWDAWHECGLADACITSPPYLNNFDYADATRLESYFWGDAKTWAELCSKVRSKMVTATTQQSSVGKAQRGHQMLAPLGPTAEEIAVLCDQLRARRLDRPRGKEYDRVLPDYFGGISLVLKNLAQVLRPGAPAVWLVGDSAPYGVYVDTPRLIAKIAEQNGFAAERDELLRYRGQRWTTRSKMATDIKLAERLVLLRRTSELM